MRLIDADELTFNRLTDSICQGQAEDVVAEAPTIETDLVRCGECSRSATDEVGNTLCMWLRAVRRPTDFCSYGKRRSDEIDRR